MKNLFILLFIIISSYVYSQTDYPKMSVDSAGVRIVILTLQQAQDLDNKTELLPLYEKMITQIDRVDSTCIKTISEKDSVINSLDNQINSQKNLLSGKNKEIINLTSLIDNYKSTEETYKREIENKNKEINLHIEQINRLRGKILISGGVGVVIGFITGFIIFH